MKKTKLSLCMAVGALMASSAFAEVTISNLSSFEINNLVDGKRHHQSIVNKLEEENPCFHGKSRLKSNTVFSNEEAEALNAHYGKKTYYGITDEGDFASIIYVDGKPNLEVYTCETKDFKIFEYGLDFAEDFSGEIKDSSICTQANPLPLELYVGLKSDFAGKQQVGLLFEETSLSMGKPSIKAKCEDISGSSRSIFDGELEIQGSKAISETADSGSVQAQ